MLFIAWELLVLVRRLYIMCDRGAVLRVVVAAIVTDVVSCDRVHILVYAMVMHVHTR